MALQAIRNASQPYPFAYLVALALTLAHFARLVVAVSGGGMRLGRRRARRLVVAARPCFPLQLAPGPGLLNLARLLRIHLRGKCSHTLVRRLLIKKIDGIDLGRRRTPGYRTW